MNDASERSADDGKRLDFLSPAWNVVGCAFIGCAWINGCAPIINEHQQVDIHLLSQGLAMTTHGRSKHIHEICDSTMFIHACRKFLCIIRGRDVSVFTLFQMFLAQGGVCQRFNCFAIWHAFSRSHLTLVGSLWCQSRTSYMRQSAHAIAECFLWLPGEPTPNLEATVFWKTLKNAFCRASVFRWLHYVS